MISYNGFQSSCMKKFQQTVWTDFLSVSHKTNEMLLKKPCRLLDKTGDTIILYGFQSTNDQFKLLH